jgi:hypothetical protein
MCAVCSSLFVCAISGDLGWSRTPIMYACAADVGSGSPFNIFLQGAASYLEAKLGSGPPCTWKTQAQIRNMQPVRPSLEVGNRYAQWPMPMGIHCTHAR